MPEWPAALSDPAVQEERIAGAESVVVLRTCWVLLGLGILAGPVRGDIHFKVSTAESDGPRIAVLAIADESGAMGVEALRQIACWPIERGELRLGVLAAPLSHVRLGTGFTSRAGGVDDLVSGCDLVVVLEEDYDFRGEIPEAHGATVAGDAAHALVRRLAPEVLKAVNRTVEDAGEKWRPVDATRLVGGAPALTLTTSTKDMRKSQRPAIRQRQFRVALHAMLHELDMLGNSISPDTLFGPRAADEPLRVAIYDDDGVISSSGHGPWWVQHSVGHFGWQTELVERRLVQAGGLDQFDVVVFGGGYANTQGKELATEGREAVRAFVRQGGGYVGFCAGAYLSGTGRDDYLHLIDGKVISKPGGGVTAVAFDAPELGHIGTYDVKFSGWPTFALQEDTTCKVLGRLAGDVTPSSKSKDRSPFGKGAPVVVSTQFGRGRVLVFCPHPERYPGPQAAFWNAIKWAGAAGDEGAVESAASVLEKATGGTK